MASAICSLASIYIVLHIFNICPHSYAAFPDFGVIQDIAVDVQKILRIYFDEVTGFEKLQKFYQDETINIDLKDVKGKELVEEMAKNLGKLLEKKVSALKKSVEWAENKAIEYSWADDLKIEDIEYVDSKKINLSDSAYQYSDLYGQIVSFENSSVHIPVEIYKGTIQILNDLSWTSQIDEQWQRNKEEDPDLLWQFFGSQTGIMRNYPSSVWLEDPEVPDLYDVRRRPWYTQGISSPKDMLILVDTSGSTQGIALTLMKQAIESLLDTLSSNDFINIVHFAAEAAAVVPCFDTFVQANHWNKEILRKFVSDLKAKDMASFIKAFEYAFVEFRKLENVTDEVGARCNKVIMFLTDGGSEMPEEVFQKYNGDKSVRVFSYAVGPTASPIEAVRWTACENKGFFYKIPAMGAIRSTVQDYVYRLISPLAKSSSDVKQSDTYFDQYSYYKFLAYGLAESQTQDGQWTHIYADSLAYETVLSQQRALAFDRDVGWTNLACDPRGLGMMTTVTMPVYNRTLDASNQTILGVMGTDLTISNMQHFTQTKQLGPNGYVMAINTNGYILMHPDLTAQNAWVPHPVNVDFLDIEYASPAKEELRRHMIDGESGDASITAYIYAPDQRHIDNSTRMYYYTAIPDSTFSLAVVLPPYSQTYFAGRSQQIPLHQGLNSLKMEDSAVLLAQWNYCPDFHLPDNTTLFEDYVAQLLANSTNCDMTLLQHLFTDGNVTKQMEPIWEDAYNGENNGVYAFITATNAGMTRIYPANASDLMENYKDPWQASYYKRSFDYDHWIYTAPFYDTVVNGNSSTPLILASRTVKIKSSSNNHIPAVIGAWVEQQRLRELMFKRVKLCALIEIYSCYFVDDGGFLILSNTDDDANKVGLFFGDEAVEPVLMNKLVNLTVYLQNIQYDYQAACLVVEEQDSGAPALQSIIQSFVFDMMSVSWWTSKLTWSWLNIGIMQWLFFSPQQYSAHAEPVEDYNVSCVKQITQYTFNTVGDKTEQKEDLLCENCTRKFATSQMKESNLLFVMVEKDCGGFCQPPPLLQAPVKVEDPKLVEARSGECSVKQRYRKRPSCYDSNPNEDTSACSRGVVICWCFVVLLLTSFATCEMIHPESMLSLFI